MTKGIPVRRVYTGDRTLDEAQRTGQDAAQKFNNSIFNGGVLLSSEEGKPPKTGLLFTVAVARSIKHGLGRKAVGFYEVYGADLPSAAYVGLRATAHPNGISSATHVTITPASTGTCFLFIF